MASSVIEDARALAEDADLYDRELAHLLLALQQPQVPHRNRLATEHRASDLANRIVSRSIALRHALDPTNQDRQDEIDALAGNTKHDASSDSTADLAEFYQRLAKVKDYHRKYPNAQNVRVGTDRQVDFAALENNDPEWLDKRFTGDEGLGRYLDLHQLHDQWNNLAPPSASGQASAGGWKRYSYLQYLAALADFNLSRQLKSTPAYATYLTDLLAYLSGFYERVFPLGDLDQVLQAADNDFARRWDAGQVPGWEQQSSATAEENGGAGSSESGIWCAACESWLPQFCLLSSRDSCAQERERERGNSADGRPRPGQKSFAKDSVYQAHLTGKKHVKAAAKLAADSASASASASASGDAAPQQQQASGPSSSQQNNNDLVTLRRQKDRAIALKEALITSLVSSSPPAPSPSSSTTTGETTTTPGPLAQILTDTLANTERRAALTDKERAAEIEELEAREAAEAAAAAAAAAAASKNNGSGAGAGAGAGGGGGGEGDDDEDEEARIYNPLKLPLGWDGKPIPYWLYKLHGLGTEYRCEICSDYVYQGR